MGRMEGIWPGRNGTDQKSDGRTYYEAHAWVRADSDGGMHT